LSREKQQIEHFNGSSQDFPERDISSAEIVDFQRKNFLAERAFRNKVLRARCELETKGITSEQEKGHGIFSDRIYKNVYPYDYMRDRVLREFLFGRDKDRGEISKERKDAWGLYLGIPQKNNTFGISDHYPSLSKDKDKYYYCFDDPEFRKKILADILNTDKDYLSKLEKQNSDLLSRLEKLKTNPEIIVKKQKNVDDFQHKKRIAKIIHNIEIRIKNNNASISRYKKNGLIHLYDDRNKKAVMGNFIGSKGQDKRGHYISYYDKWDLTPKIFDKRIPMEKIAGKPFEIYDRIYYDPRTGEMIDDVENNDSAILIAKSET